MWESQRRRYVCAPAAPGLQFGTKIMYTIGFYRNSCPYLCISMIVSLNKITWLVHRAWWEATNLGDGVFRLTLTLLLKEILGGLANSSSDEENMRCWYFGGLLALSQENCLSFFFIMGTSGRFNRGGLQKLDFVIFFVLISCYIAKAVKIC